MIYVSVKYKGCTAYTYPGVDTNHQAQSLVALLLGIASGCDPGMPQTLEWVRIEVAP